MNARTPAIPAAENQMTTRATRAMLHLTNGTAVVPLMREAGVNGRVVPWNDVLHEGPVPIGLNPAAMRDRRADFLASCGWGSAEAIARDLAARDAALADLTDVDEVTLWLEHDLYDQLQLLQILDRLPLDGTPRVTAVPDDEYLGALPAARFRGLYEARRDVTSAERLAARDAWTAFRSPDPRAIVEVLPRVDVLRHLGPALVRHLQQFPSMANGLSRTEQQALEVVGQGVTRLRDVYIASHHNREPALFMGDAAFAAHLEHLVRGSRPLLHMTQGPSTAAGSSRRLTIDDEVALTDDGHRVLEGQLDRVRAGGINRWLGGVELSGTGPMWRWDQEREKLRLA
jgi:hypothetical protein